MEELSPKYVLLTDLKGYTEERNMGRLKTGLRWTLRPILSGPQVSRGELFEALPEAEQPKDDSKIALVGIDRKSALLECGMEFVTRLTEEDANLLLAISSLGERYQTYMDRIRLDLGRKIGPGSKVYVTVKGVSKVLPGVVWYKGELLSCSGTMFGVELIENPGLGTSDGTFRNKRYFTRSAGSGVFVGLDKLTPRGDPISKSSKKAESHSRTSASHTGEKQQEQLRGKGEREANLIRQLRQTEQQRDNVQRELGNCREQMRGRTLREASLLEQLRVKEQEQENSQRQLTEMEQRLTNCQGQLQERDLREGSLHEQLREREQQQENLRRERAEIQERLANCEGQIREKDEEMANIQQRVSTLERQLRVKEQEMNELELSLTTARQTLSQQRQQETCDWVISRYEIQLTDKCLGRGGWGSVNEGTYCGCSIAVKQIHELILSPHNRRLFEREMNIASRCRHPCLLQFIGATNDEGSPLFVTELMETSLRALLGQRELSKTEITLISLDVARALNYLHQKKPSPIIHRDVSSANVLLWRQGDQWRAKVSDYGTANFIQQTMTVAPGAPIYSAPEAHSSSQTAMVDVYSFGVLLCEICIRELPDPGRREEQLLMVTNRVLRGLVRRCLQAEPVQRPNMEEIIQELEQFTETL